MKPVDMLLKEAERLEGQAKDNEEYVLDMAKRMQQLGEQALNWRSEAKDLRAAANVLAGGAS